MSYGIRTWGPSGEPELNENSFTARIILSTLLTAGSPPGSYWDISVPGCTPANSCAVTVPIGPLPDPSTQDPRARQFEPEMMNGVVRVWRGHRTAVEGISASGTQRLIVMRFR